MKILVINAGSSSLKFQLIDMVDESVKAKGLVERIGIEGTHFKQTVAEGNKVIEFTRNMADHTEAIAAVLEALTDKENGAIASLDEIGACGHRVLHGGETFKESALVTEESLKAIKDLIPLGPLHQRPNIAGIEACQAVMPGKPNVAVFDTAFHQTMPPKAFLYAVPYEYYKNLKVRRYGFHGTSHRFIAGETPKYLGKDPKDCKFIICHLGNGSSLSAIVGGKVVDTSMGLTPLEGVVMGTRSGDVDPAVLEYIMDNTGMDIHEMLNVLNKKSGFAGLSVSSDMRDVKAAAANGDEQAKNAVDIWTYRLQKYIGAYMAAIQGADAIVFTAGIGENDTEACAEVIEGFEWMGIKVDPAKNVRGACGIISTDDSTVKVLRIPTNEELPIARDTLEIVSKL
ncbi:MAG: acetate kinase [Christensenellales bacterium]|nr:acetate kinase [Christensenellales bacterium]